MKHQRSIDIFLQIDPKKKFSEFVYQDLQWDEVNAGDCRKGVVLKIDGIYYMYSRNEYFLTSDEFVKSKIIFKQGRKVYKEIQK
jgi:hypothetical protein